MNQIAYTVYHLLFMFVIGYLFGNVIIWLLDAREYKFIQEQYIAYVYNSD